MCSHPVSLLLGYLQADSLFFTQMSDFFRSPAGSLSLPGVLDPALQEVRGGLAPSPVHSFAGPG